MGRALRKYWWTFIVYPESAPEWWMDELESLHVEAFISPLHDQDRFDEQDIRQNPGRGYVVGELKKPHYHVVLHYDSQMTARGVLDDLKPLGVRHVEPVKSARGMQAYLIHANERHKVKYQESDVICLSGAVYDGEDARLKIRRVEKELKAIIDEMNFTEYWHLWAYALDNEQHDWCDYIRSNHGHVSTMIASRRNAAIRRYQVESQAVDSV